MPHPVCAYYFDLKQSRASLVRQSSCEQARAFLHIHSLSALFGIDSALEADFDFRCCLSTAQRGAVSP